MTVKPGVQTTEFYVTAATQILAALATFHVVNFTDAQTQTVLGLATMAITSGAYAIARAVTKHGAAAATASPPVTIFTPSPAAAAPAPAAPAA